MTTEKELKDLLEIRDRIIEDIEYNSEPHYVYGRIDVHNGINYKGHQAFDVIKEMGYYIGDTYHLNGIGNNNRGAIIKRFEVNGYTTEVIIGYINYNYGIHCREAYLYLEDKDHVNIWSAKNQFPRLHSENE